MFDRISPVYDAMNRTMTLGLDQRWRRATADGRGPSGRPGARRVLRHRRPRARGAGAPAATVTGLDFSERMLERARAQVGRDRVGAGRRARAAVRGRGLRRRDGRLRRRATSTTSSAVSRSCGASCGPGGRLAILEITRPRGVLAPFYRLWFDRLVPLLGQASFPAARPTRTCLRACAASPARTSSPSSSARPGFEDVRFRLFAGGIVALHTGVAA